MPSICIAGTAAAAMLQQGPMEGRVHSVFRRVLNVEMPALAGAVDNLYSLGRQDVPPSPAMLVTDLRRAFFGVSPGDVIRVHSDLIEVGNTASPFRKRYPSGDRAPMYAATWRIGKP